MNKVYAQAFAAVLFLWGGANVSMPAAQEKPLVLSCAAFPADLRESDLVARYGRENVITAPVTGADDGPTDGTVLFPGQADVRIEISWWDPETKEKPDWIRIQGARSRWRLPNGITLGDDLVTIERRNGWPFRLASFSSEGQGAVQSWGRGRIENVDASNCAIKISFQPRRDETEDPGLMRQVIGGRGFSSGHPAMQVLNPRVAAIWIRHLTR